MERIDTHPFTPTQHRGAVAALSALIHTWNTRTHTTPHEAPERLDHAARPDEDAARLDDAA